jgi:hypothetical protein
LAVVVAGVLTLHSVFGWVRIVIFVLVCQQLVTRPHR